MTAIEMKTAIQHPYQTHLSAGVDNIDDLVRLAELVKEQQKRLRICEFECRSALALMTQGEARTRRLVGEQFKVKLEFPADYWSQSPLKELWTGDPELSKIYLRIGRLDPNLREVKKLENASGNERFEKYKAKLLGAREPSMTPPTLTVESDGSDEG